jgi:hypothetical protein
VHMCACLWFPLTFTRYFYSLCNPAILGSMYTFIF